MSEIGDKSNENEQELRKRIVGAGGDEKLISDEKLHSKPASLSPADSENEQRIGSDSDHIDSEEEKLPEEKDVEEMAKNLPQGTDKTPEVLDSALKGLSDRWKNWVIRGIFTFIMISGFCLMIAGGPVALMITTLTVQVKCFQEIISIGYQVYRIHGLPWFRSLSWYFLLTSNYFFYGESLFDYFGVFFNRIETFRFLITYHRFLSFSLYCVGFVWFVLTLVKKYYKRQITLFVWTHIGLLIVVTQTNFVIQNMFEGLIWFIVPLMMIVCNDFWAYMFGFFFGKTPLIKLSPKKTWEGFIGGGFSTLVFGLILSYFLCQYQYFVCPVKYSEAAENLVLECEPSYLFRLQDYKIQMGSFETSISLYPFMWHSLSLSFFSSVIGPFGGFFASGFKRAFKIKDFSDVIPGHGGIMDRFDCQFLMATFVNVYISSFIRSASPQKLLAMVYTLKPEQQIEFFNELKEALASRNLVDFS